MFPINFNFPYRKKDGSLITMEKALDGAGVDLDLIDLDDVAITNPADGDGLVYDATAQKWENKQITSVSFDEYTNKGIQIKVEKFGKMARITLLGTTSESVSGIVYTLPDKYKPKNVNAQGLAINGSTGAILGITTVGTDKNLVINATVASGTVVRSTTICYITA